MFHWEDQQTRSFQQIKTLIAKANNTPIDIMTGIYQLQCRLIQVSLGIYRVLYTFFWPAEFPGYHQ